MPLLTKVGSFAPAVGAQSVVGLGFQPKAIIFWATNAADSMWTAHGAAAIGFATSGTNQMAVGISSANAEASSVASRCMSDSLCVYMRNTPNNADWANISLTSMDVDGFTVQVNAWAITGQVNYLALGGSDITAAKAISWIAPAGATAPVTGVGFKPDLVFHANNAMGTIPNTAGTAHLSFGCMNKHGQQWANGVAIQTAVNPSNTWRYQQTDACHLLPSSVDGTVAAQYHYQSMDADGFTLYGSSIQQHSMIGLCLKGVSSKISAFPKREGNGAQIIERVGFTPKALLFNQIAKPSNAGPLVDAGWQLGAVDSALSTRSIAIFDTDAVSPTQSHGIWNQYAIWSPDTGQANRGAASVTSHDIDGFSLTWGNNPAAGYQFEILYLALGDMGKDTFPSMVVQMAEVLSSTATAYSNQRKLDRCQNGVLWALVSKEAYHLAYSMDDGRTWTDYGNIGGSGGNYVENASIFIDLDDYLHIVYKNGFNAYTTYLRGTPNATRTAWTFSAATTLSTVIEDNYPDIVAHREGIDWKVHVVWSHATSTPNNYASYCRVNVSSSGTITVESAGAGIGGSYAVNAHTYPSIDFRHTGDGKTVATQPDLYVAWSAGKDGAGFGIRFRKATYSAGSWTWGTETPINEGVYIDSPARWFNCLFDGTRILVGGYGLFGGAGYRRFYELDPSTLVKTTLWEPAVSVTSSDEQINYGSMTYDAAGNIYVISKTFSTAHPIYLNIYTRGTATWSGKPLDTSGPDTTPYVSTKRGGSFGRIEWIYTTGNNAPYQVKYDVLRMGSGVRVWNGSAWVIKPVKEWNGSAWVAREMKYWNGSTWVLAE